MAHSFHSTVCIASVIISVMKVVTDLVSWNCIQVLVNIHAPFERQTPSPSPVNWPWGIWLDNLLIIFPTNVFVYFDILPDVFTDVWYMTHWVKVLSDGSASLTFSNVMLSYQYKLITWNVEWENKIVGDTSLGIQISRWVNWTLSNGKEFLYSSMWWKFQLASEVHL